MSVALRTICYAGSRDRGCVCHSQAHSFTVVGCLSPCDTTVRRIQHDRGYGSLPYREGIHAGHFLYVPLICSNVALIRQHDGQAERYSLQKSDSALSHAAAVCALLQIREIYFGKQGCLSLAHKRTLTVTAGLSVTPQIVFRSSQPAQPGLEPGGCAVVKQKRVQHVPHKGQKAMMCYSLCLSLAVDTEDRELVTSHRVTHSDLQTVINVSTSCSGKVWLLSTSPATLPPAPPFDYLSQISHSVLLELSLSSLSSGSVCPSLKPTHTHTFGIPQWHSWVQTLSLKTQIYN